MAVPLDGVKERGYKVIRGSIPEWSHTLIMSRQGQNICSIEMSTKHKSR
jgi:hypothetical protein